MIIGKCSITYFLWYVCNQVRNITKAISGLMAGNKVFYTIPKSEVIYYTPEQSVT